MRRLLAAVLAAVVLLPAVGCTARPAEPESGKLRVVCSLFPYYDFVRAIGGEDVEAELVVPAGRETHRFEPTPLDVIRLSKADVFVYNGGESEYWVEEILDSAGEAIPYPLRLMDYAQPLEEELAEGMQGAGHDDHHDHDDEDEHHCHHHHDHDEDDDEHEHHCCHHHDHDDHDEDEDEHHCCHHHHHHGHDADEVFQSWGVETPKKFTEEEIRNALAALDNGETYGIVLRAKGIVPTADGTWLHFDHVPGEIDVRTGTAAVTGRLCVIGSKLDEKALAALFGV